MLVDGERPYFRFPVWAAGLRLWAMHPIAFELGPLSIHWYGVMVALGFLAGLWTASRRGLRAGIAAEKIIDLGPWLIIGAIVGARTLYVISYWRESFAGKPIWEIFAVWKGGLVYYGGLIGASLACILYVRLKKLPLWKVADILRAEHCPGLRLRTHRLPAQRLLLRARLRLALGHSASRQAIPLNPPTYPVHPTEVYDSLLNLGLYAALAWLFRRKKFDGQVFGVYLVSYAVLRSFVEMFRGDYPAAPTLPGRLGHAGAPGEHSASSRRAWCCCGCCRAPKRSEDRGLRIADGRRSRPPSSILHPPSSSLLLAGPTAVGKSEIALRLAERARRGNRLGRFHAGLSRDGHRHRPNPRPRSAPACPIT